MSNQQICNRWYRDHKENPSPEKERLFWEGVFDKENQNFVRHNVMLYDLSHVLQHYLQNRQKVFATQLKKHPSYVQAYMENWWQDLCRAKTPKSAQVLHQFFAQPNTSMARTIHQNLRLEDMMRANLWDLALNNLSAQIAPSVQWDLLQKIMSNDGEWINKNDWSGTLNKLKVYVCNGGECDLRADKPYQHIVNTHWMTDLLLESRYDNQRPKMLKKLFRFGIQVHDFDFSAASAYAEMGAKIQLAWDEHNKECLLKTLQGTGSTAPARRM